MSTEDRERLLNELHKSSNAIIECSRLLTEKLWKSDMEPSDFVVAGLADAIVSSAEKLGELLDNAGTYIVHDHHPQAVARADDTAG